MKGSKTRMSLFSIGKKTIEKCPHLLKIASFTYRLICINSTNVKGSNNIIRKDNAFVKRTNIKVIGSNNNIILGSKCVFNNVHIYIYGNNNRIVIGDKVYLKDTDLHIEDDNNEIAIGESTTIFGKTHLACIEGEKITIGKDCMFSTDVTFRTGDSHSIIDMYGKRINGSESITIGNHVWFGNKTIITKGVEISDNSIIGTGSIVTKKFNKGGIILAGNPARVVKENINWLRERI